jgi:hypothetical protein
MTKYKLTEEVVKEAANFMAKAAQLTLQAKHTRTAIRAKWKKVGRKLGTRRAANEAKV